MLDMVSMRVLGFLFFISVAFLSCEHHQRRETFRYKLPPPEMDIDDNAMTICEDLHCSETTRLFRVNKFIVVDSPDIYDWILFAKVLFDDYGLVARPNVDSIDRVCIKPTVNKMVEQEFAVKSVNDLTDAVKIKVKSIEDSIGLYQIRKGLYYVADILPKYKGEPGFSNLYYDVEQSKLKYKRRSKNRGFTMFYLIIDKTGDIKDVEIRQHLDKETDSLSKLIMQNLPYRWTPAKIEGKDVDFYLQYLILWP